MNNTINERGLREIIGDPRRLDAEMQQFRRDTKLLSSKHRDFSAQYPKRWIAVYGGRVQADALTLEQLLVKLDALQVPREHTVIRYMSQNPRRMIL